MVAFCFGLGEDWASAGVVPVNSVASLVAAGGSGEDVGASGVVVRPRFRGGRPWTAETLLSRAITLDARLCSVGGVDRDDSFEDA